MSKGTASKTEAARAVLKEPPTLRETRTPSGGAEKTDGTAIPFAGYDGLNAAAIAARLRGMTVAQLKHIETYEAAHRSRESVIAAVRSARAAITHGHRAASF